MMALPILKEIWGNILSETKITVLKVKITL
jgi:hypothetical protein